MDSEREEDDDFRATSISMWMWRAARDDSSRNPGQRQGRALNGALCAAICGEPMIWLWKSATVCRHSLLFGFPVARSLVCSISTVHRFWVPSLRSQWV